MYVLATAFERTGQVQKAPVNWRNPLLSHYPEPRSLICSDTLHVLYLGPVKHMVAWIIWRTLLANPWGIVGDQSVRNELGLKYIYQDLQKWYEENKVPWSLRLGDLSLSMIGSASSPDFTGKAAESGVTLQWATQYATRWSHHLREGPALVEASQALEEYLQLLRDTPQTVDDPTFERFFKLFLRHVHALEDARVPFLPKHHMLAHLTIQMREKGNPRFYSTFLDETLNSIIAAAAARAHPSRWEHHIHKRLSLQATLQSGSHFAAL